MAVNYTHADIPEELKKKIDSMKTKLDKFQKEVLKKFDKYIVAMSILPPEKQKPLPPGIPPAALAAMQKKQSKPDENIDIFILVDDADSKNMAKFELKNRLFKIIDKLAVDIDPIIRPQVMILTELREACFDGRYEILNLIGMSAVLHDPKDMIAAIKISDLHKNMVLKRFDKYIVSYIAVGSLFRGDSKSNDIDVAVVIDDTDVKKMSRIELKDRLMGIIREMGYEAGEITKVKKQFHIQCYILTDFWEAVKEASPVIFTFLRDGVPLYDRGVFMPWKLLLEMGRIKPSRESIDIHMDAGNRLLNRAKGRMVSVVAEDIYYAILNPTQAALMLYGLAPPTPKETIKLMEEIFVKKEKILEMKYVEILKKVRKYYKDIEHLKIKDVTGKELDSLLKDAEDYSKRIDKLFKDIQKKTESISISDFHDSAMVVVQEVLNSQDIKSKNIELAFASLVKKGLFPKKYLQTLKNISKVKQNFKKMKVQEVEKIKRESAFFIRDLKEFLQRKQTIHFARNAFRVKYSDKVAEIIFCKDHVYVVKNVTSKPSEQEIVRSKYSASKNTYEAFSKTAPEELHKEFNTDVKIKKSSLTIKDLETLEKVLGSKVELLL
jgi:uncharacterized protein (UPF0332 family)